MVDSQSILSRLIQPIGCFTRARVVIFPLLLMRTTHFCQLLTLYSQLQYFLYNKAEVTLIIPWRSCQSIAIAKTAFFYLSCQSRSLASDSALLYSLRNSSKSFIPYFIVLTCMSAFWQALGLPKALSIATSNSTIYRGFSISYLATSQGSICWLAFSYKRL